MNMRNTNGTKTDLWGAPDAISLIVETWLLIDIIVVFPLGMSETSH